MYIDNCVRNVPVIAVPSRREVPRSCYWYVIHRLWILVVDLDANSQWFVRSHIIQGWRYHRIDYDMTIVRIEIDEVVFPMEGQKKVIFQLHRQMRGGIHTH